MSKTNSIQAGERTQNQQAAVSSSAAALMAARKTLDMRQGNLDYCLSVRGHDPRAETMYRAKVQAAREAVTLAGAAYITACFAHRAH